MNADTLAHGSAEFATLAFENTILLGQVGSGLHGVTTGADDRDEMGICIEPPEFVIGNRRFEQFQYRTQPEGSRSGPGDLDLVVYSLRKWARLTAAGNPTVLLMMYLPPSEVVHIDGPGYEIQQRPELFLSRQAAARFSGYLTSQREQMQGLRGRRHTNRPELVEVFGFDTKFAYHMVRLGIQGVELLTTGKITLPIPEPDRTWLLELRRGEHTKEEALDRAADLQAQLVTLRRTADLPNKVDTKQLDAWLVDTYQKWWRRNG
ncbi:nucleotidyltransferase [Rhodococcus sp. 15-2388-1-1a]|uniref:DNA polymerase beta superfamily protein n=1 Tax=Nocardiaceae TaxID=85025 RepID=UPI000568D8E3|nr:MULTISPECIES: nucleotidyltransferase domain-containing protein [Rhodococcus]OZE95113.1 nucleotidyltransferase [Rhodococcus sp. 15-2388-1-1a]